MNAFISVGWHEHYHQRDPAIPVPPSPETSKALLEAFAERGIAFMGSTRIVAVDDTKVTLDTGMTLPCDLFLGVPRNRAADVVVASGMTDDQGWVTVDPLHPRHQLAGRLRRRRPRRHGRPKAGVFAEGAAKAVAANIVSRLRHEAETARNPGFGSCYIEFGADRIAEVDVDFFSGPQTHRHLLRRVRGAAPGQELFGSSRLSRWFGK